MKIFHLATTFAFALGIVGCSGEKHPQLKPLTPQQLHGQSLYQRTCAVCHRADSSEPLNGPGMKGIFSGKYMPSGAPANDERVMDVIVHGRRTMPGYGQVLEDQQIKDIVAYMHTL